MKEIEEVRGFLMLMWEGEVIMTAEFSGDQSNDSVAKTKTYGKVSEELAAALTLASVVALCPPSIQAKLLASIKHLTAINEKRSEDDLPF